MAALSSRYADDLATESETKAGLDRFCDAMLAVRAEIAQIENGELDRDDNQLKNAPHTMEDLVKEWNHPYSREAAHFPPGAIRVDNAWGDRNLACTCSSIEEYAEAAE